MCTLVCVLTFRKIRTQTESIHCSQQLVSASSKLQHGPSHLVPIWTADHILPHTHSISHTSTPSLSLSLTPSLAIFFTHSLTHSLSHSLSHSLPHSLTGACSPIYTTQNTRRATMNSTCRKSPKTNIHGRSTHNVSSSSGTGRERKEINQQ